MRLLSWNVQWCRGVDGRVDPARIAREAKRLADPDVVCLQEVAQGFAASLPGSQGEDQIAALAKEFAGYAHAFAWGVDIPDTHSRGGRSRFGNLILSRLSIGRVLRHSLPWPADPGVPSMPRVALEVSVDAPFGALRIVGTHLEYYSAVQRADQVERLRALHAEAWSHSAPPSGRRAEGPFAHVPRAGPALFVGDFNFPPGDALHTRMQGPFGDATPRLIDAWSALHPRDPHPATTQVHDAQPGETPHCCDYVFVSEDLLPRLAALRVDADTQASDHQPLIVELKL